MGRLFTHWDKKRQHVGPGAEGGLWGCRCLGKIVSYNDGAVGESLSG